MPTRTATRFFVDRWRQNLSKAQTKIGSNAMKMFLVEACHRLKARKRGANAYTKATNNGKVPVRLNSRAMR